MLEEPIGIPLREDAIGKPDELEDTIPLFPLLLAHDVPLASAAALAMSSSKCIDDSEIDLNTMKNEDKGGHDLKNICIHRQHEEGLRTNESKLFHSTRLTVEVKNIIAT